MPTSHTFSGMLSDHEIQASEVRERQHSVSPLTLSTPLRSLLASQEVLRVVLNPGGGVGNYKASFEVIRRLRQLGFMGQIDLCFHAQPKLDRKENFSNLQVFLPQINTQQIHEQPLIHPEFGELIFRTLPYQEIAHNIPFVPIAITGADHCFAGHTHFTLPKAILYHASQYIILNPTGWPTYELNTVELFTLRKTIVLPPDSRIAVSHDYEFTSDLLPNAQLANLFQALEDGQAQNQLKFILAYGLSNSPGWICPALELARLLSAAKHALTTTPLVCIVPYDNSVTHCPETDLRTYAQIYTQKNIDRLLIEITNKTLKKPAIVFTERLPERCFDFLAGNAWLVLGEGCNLITQRESAGLPFLHGGRKLTALTKLGSSSPFALRAIEHLHHRANQYLEQTASQEKDALIEFFSLLNKDDGRLIAYFQARHQMYQKKPELVITSLAILAVVQPDMRHTAFIKQLLRFLNDQQQKNTMLKSGTYYHSNPALMRLKQLQLANTSNHRLHLYYLYFLSMISKSYIEKASLYTGTHAANLFLDPTKGYLVHLIADYVEDPTQRSAFSDWATSYFLKWKKPENRAELSTTTLITLLRALNLVSIAHRVFSSDDSASSTSPPPSPPIGLTTLWDTGVCSTLQAASTNYAPSSLFKPIMKLNMTC